MQCHQLFLTVMMGKYYYSWVSCLFISGLPLSQFSNRKTVIVSAWSSVWRNRLGTKLFLRSQNFSFVHTSFYRFASCSLGHKEQFSTQQVSGLVCQKGNKQTKKVKIKIKTRKLEVKRTAVLAVSRETELLYKLPSNCHFFSPANQIIAQLLGEKRREVSGGGRGSFFVVRSGGRVGRCEGGWHFVICFMLRSLWGANERHHF